MLKFFKKKAKKTHPVPTSDTILNLQDLMVYFQQASHLTQHSSRTHGNQAACQDQMQVDFPIAIPSSSAPPDTMNRISDNSQMQVDHTVARPSSSAVQNVQSGHPQGRRRRRRDRVSSIVSFGQDQAFNHVCNFLRDDVCTVGIYGVGGAGKTTLLKKIRRDFLEPSNFNAIWVTVSKSFDVGRIQREVMEGMQLCFDQNESKYKRAEQIRKEGKEKKVALLIDDIWEGFNLEELEILDRMDFEPSNFIVIFTARLEKACKYMQFDANVRVGMIRGTCLREV